MANIYRLLTMSKYSSKCCIALTNLAIRQLFVLRSLLDDVCSFTK